jgi:hypothetical protein
MLSDVLTYDHYKATHTTEVFPGPWCVGQTTSTGAPWLLLMNPAQYRREENNLFHHVYQQPKHHRCRWCYCTLQRIEFASR